MLKRCIFIALLFLGHISHADDGPFALLIDHSLIDNLERDGEWEVTFFESTVMYECLKCEGSVKAEIEVFPVRGNENLAGFQESYLYQRKLFCANLVVEGIGRCLDTQPRSIRLGMLSGFRSSQIIGSRKEFETALFSLDWDNKPIAMKATVYSEIESDASVDILDTLEWHMRRLTRFW